MSPNSYPFVVCLLFLIALLLTVTAGCVCGWLLRRIREHDERARANRRRHAIDEVKWRDLERRADLQAAIHRRLTGAA